MIKSNKKCYKMCLDAIRYHSHVFAQPLDSSFKARGEENIVVVYLWKTSTELRFYKKSYISNDTVDCSKVVVKCQLITANVVELKNSMYLFGMARKTFVPVAKRFDGKSKV